MRTLALTSFLFALSACATQRNTFKGSWFESARYPYVVHYAGDGPNEIVNRIWRVANYYKSGSSLKPKEGPEYEVDRRFDIDDDGSFDTTRTEPFYDLLLEHTRKDAAMWLRTVPLSRKDRDKALEVIASRYIEAASGAGAIAVRFGHEGDVGFVERRFATRVLQSKACEVSGREAYAVDFEVANVDQLQLADTSRWRRGRLVIVRPRFMYDLKAWRTVNIPCSC